MQKGVSRLFFVLVLSVLLIVGCGSQNNDVSLPTFTLEGEPQRTISTNSVIIEGTLQDNIKIATFEYRLNHGLAQNVLDKLQNKIFKFDVGNLEGGENTITLLATDSSSNAVEVTLQVNVIPDTATPPTSNPEISVDGGNYRQITTDHLTLRGGVEDNDGVASLTYQLNDGTVQNITSALEQDRFEIEITGLHKGANSVYFTATDTLGNKATLEVAIDATNFVVSPAIKGLWGQQLTYDVCGSQEIALSFTFDKPGNDGSVTGSAKILNFTGETVSTTLTGYVTTPESFWLETTYTNKMTVQIYLILRGDKLEGQARIESVPTDWCEYGPTTGFLDVSLNRNETLPQPPRDVAYEPNNDFKQAKQISSPATIPLFTPSGDRDWFKITLTEKSLLDIVVEESKVHLQISEPLSGGYSQIYSFTYTEPFRRILEAGSYYIKVSIDDCFDCVNPLSTLHVSSTPLPDKHFEPNDTRETSTLISEGFSGEFTVFARDTDWFKFTLSETMVVTIGFENEWKANPGDGLDLKYTLVKSDEQSGSLYSYYYPIVRILSAGIYYLSVTSSYPEDFSLTFTSAPLIDVAYEPNNTKGEATPLTDGFNATMFLGAGDFCDIFTFTLAQPKLITLDLGSEKFKYQVSYNDSSAWNEYAYEGVPLHKVYGAFTHYIRVCINNLGFISDNPNSRRTYPVRFTIEDAP
jgi:hypothetical protein